MNDIQIISWHDPFELFQDILYSQTETAIVDMGRMVLDRLTDYDEIRQVYLHARNRIEEFGPVV